MKLTCGLLIPDRGFIAIDTLDPSEARDFFMIAQDELRNPIEIVEGVPHFIEGLPCLIWDHRVEKLLSPFRKRLPPRKPRRRS